MISNHTMTSNRGTVVVMKKKKDEFGTPMSDKGKFMLPSTSQGSIGISKFQTENSQHARQSSGASNYFVKQEPKTMTNMKGSFTGFNVLKKSPYSRNDG